MKQICTQTYTQKRIVAYISWAAEGHDDKHCETWILQITRVYHETCGTSPRWHLAE